MKAVGIKVLKDNLSKYLKMVRDGEVIWVTDRDEVIAEIHQPTLPVTAHLSATEAFLNEQARQGRLHRAKFGSPSNLDSLCSLARPKNRVDLQQLLDEIKAE